MKQFLKTSFKNDTLHRIKMHLIDITDNSHWIISFIQLFYLIKRTKQYLVRWYRLSSFQYTLLHYHLLSFMSFHKVSITGIDVYVVVFPNQDRNMNIHRFYYFLHFLSHWITLQRVPFVKADEINIHCLAYLFVAAVSA